MPPATSEGRPVGRPTSFSTPEFVDFNYWAPTDLVIGAGAAVVDASKRKVLVLWDHVTERYRFPWARHDQKDLGAFLASPFDQISRETGYILEKLALPRLERQYKNPDVSDWRDLEVETKVLDARTDDAFFMTFDVFWFQVPEFERLDSRQRMILWYAFRAVSESPASRNVVWKSFDEAVEMLSEQQHPNAGACSALKLLAAILTEEEPETLSSERTLT